MRKSGGTQYISGSSASIKNPLGAGIGIGSRSGQQAGGWSEEGELELRHTGGEGDVYTATAV